ncbi:hypothetical protein [Pseudoxanthomonas koreensis]|uniref:hypothetical protein n=1 Tax=Pseudoxanthomonas koreensis TaxID=266061 RepID=UPI0035A62453
MPRTPEHNPESDQAKAFTPDRLRNDKARWKDRDQPDDPPDGPDPDRDYPDATVPDPRRR